MMATNIDKLHKRIREYMRNVELKTVDPQNPLVLAMPPIETTEGHFVDMKDLPDISKLAPIPEVMRDFAFRFALEFKPIKAWAKEYGRSYNAIHKWVHHPTVEAYIVLARYEQRTYMLAQRLVLQRKLNSTILDLLSTKITGTTIDAIVTISKFLYQAFNQPESLNHKNELNVIIGNNANETDVVNPYAQQIIDVTPEKLQKVKDDILQLELLSQELSKADHD